MSSPVPSSIIDTNTLWDRLVRFVYDMRLLRWFVQKGYAQGVFWAVMICVVSVTNDILMRFLGSRLHVVEISFFRFLFSMVSVLPFMFLQGGKKFFVTEQPGMHFWRAIIGALAIGLCCYSVNLIPLSEHTTIMFGEPLFFLPLAFFLLKERVDRARWFATILGFLGLVIILRPTGAETFNLFAIIPMISALLFAFLNVMAKKMIKDEHSYTLMFYFGFWTTAITLPFVFFVWDTPTLSECVFLFLLGAGGNLIQLCLFRAFTSTDASALMPFRYVEFLLSASLGFLFFSEVPTTWLLAGVSLIIASTFYISNVETKKERAACE